MADFVQNIVKARRFNRYQIRETVEVKEEVFKMFEDRLPTGTIVRLSGLSFNTILKLREKWNERDKIANVPRAVPKIQLSEEFVRSRIGLLQNPPYSSDCELATIPGLLEHYLELRALVNKKVDEKDGTR